MSTAPVTQTTGSAATTSTATDAIAETASFSGLVAINDNAEAKLILNVQSMLSAHQQRKMANSLLTGSHLAAAFKTAIKAGKNVNLSDIEADNIWVSTAFTSRSKQHLKPAASAFLVWAKEKYASTRAAAIATATAADASAANNSASNGNIESSTAGSSATSGNATSGASHANNDPHLNDGNPATSSTNADNTGNSSSNVGSTTGAAATSAANHTGSGTATSSVSSTSGVASSNTNTTSYSDDQLAVNLMEIHSAMWDISSKRFLVANHKGAAEVLAQTMTKSDLFSTHFNDLISLSNILMSSNVTVPIDELTAWKNLHLVTVNNNPQSQTSEGNTPNSVHPAPPTTNGVAPSTSNGGAVFARSSNNVQFTDGNFGSNHNNAAPPNSAQYASSTTNGGAPPPTPNGGDDFARLHNNVQFTGGVGSDQLHSQLSDVNHLQQRTPSFAPQTFPQYGSASSSSQPSYQQNGTSGFNSTPFHDGGYLSHSQPGDFGHSSLSSRPSFLQNGTPSSFMHPSFPQNGDARPSSQPPPHQSGVPSGVSSNAVQILQQQQLQQIERLQLIQQQELLQLQQQRAQQQRAQQPSGSSNTSQQTGIAERFNLGGTALGFAPNIGSTMNAAAAISGNTLFNYHFGIIIAIIHFNFVQIIQDAWASLDHGELLLRRLGVNTSDPRFTEPIKYNNKGNQIIRSVTSIIDVASCLNVTLVAPVIENYKFFDYATQLLSHLRYSLMNFVPPQLFEAILKLFNAAQEYLPVFNNRNTLHGKIPSESPQYRVIVLQLITAFQNKVSQLSRTRHPGPPTRINYDGIVEGLLRSNPGGHPSAINTCFTRALRDSIHSKREELDLAISASLSASLSASRGFPSQESNGRPTKKQRRERLAATKAAAAVAAAASLSRPNSQWSGKQLQAALNDPTHSLHGIAKQNQLLLQQASTTGTPHSDPQPKPLRFNKGPMNFINAKLEEAGVRDDFYKYRKTYCGPSDCRFCILAYLMGCRCPRINHDGERTSAPNSGRALISTANLELLLKNTDCASFLQQFKK